MLKTVDESTKVLDAGPDIRPLRIISGLPECIVSATGTASAFNRAGHDWRANLPVGTWLEIQYGEYTLDFWHAIEWRGDSRLYLAADGPALLAAASPDGPWTLAGVDARTPTGLRLLKSHTLSRAHGPLSVLVSKLSPDLLATLKKLNVAALKLESAASLDLIGHLNKLRFLNLSGLPVADFSALSFLRHLAVLDASYCAALRDISALSQLKFLQVLDLGYCEFLENAEPLFDCSRLAALNLNGCAWLNDLSGLKRLKNLMLLSVVGCANIPAAALDELQDALPHCSILRGQTCASGIEEAVRIGTLRLDLPEPFLGDGI